MVVNAEVNQTNKTTLRSEGRSTLKKNLTGPTLLEMPGNPTGKELNFRIVLRTVEMFSAILSLEIMLSPSGEN